MVVVVMSDEEFKIFKKVIMDEHRTPKEEPETDLIGETNDNGLKAINYLFKTVPEGNVYGLDGEDINNLVEAWNKL